MTFEEFQQACHTTSTYSDEAIKRGALFDGLAGEACETISEVSRLIDAESTDEYDNEKLSVAMEGCDCMWYAMELCWSLGFNLPKMAHDVNAVNVKPASDNPSFADIQEGIRSTCSNESGMTIGVYLNLAKHAGSVIESHKKMLRDDSGRWTLDRLDKVRTNLVLVINTVVHVWTLLGFDAEDMCNRLVAKLAKRAAEGKIHGSGSNR